jgi:O-antigen/teichoic acid export membrane protein
MDGSDAIPAPPDSIRGLVRRSSQVLGANGVALVLGSIQAIVVARVLGPTDLGIVAIVMVVGSVVFQILDFRTSETIVRYVIAFAHGNDHVKARAVVRLGFVVNAVTGVGAALISLLIARPAAEHLLNGAGDAYLFVIFAPFLVFSSLQTVCASTLRTFDRFALVSAYSITGTVMRFVFILLLLFAVGGPAGVLAGQSIAMTTVAVIGFVLVARVIRQDFGPPSGERYPLKRLLRELWSFMLSTNISGFFSLITKESDTLLLGFLATAHDVGLYDLAKSIGQVIMMFGDAVSSAIYPQVVRIAHADRTRLWPFLRRVTWSLSAIVVPGVAVALIFAPLLLRLAGGEAFEPAANALRVMAVGFGIATVLVWSRPAILALGRPHVATVVNGVLAAIQIGLTLLLVPRYGYFASACILAGLYAVGTTYVSLVTRATLRENASEASLQRQ